MDFKLEPDTIPCFTEEKIEVKRGTTTLSKLVKHLVTAEIKIQELCFIVHAFNLYGHRILSFLV